MLLNASLLNTALLNGDDGNVEAGPHSGLPGSGRYISGAELDLLTTAPEYAVHARVKIADAAGQMQDYHLRSGYDWQDEIQIEGNIDAPIGTATVKLWREVKQKSLAPFRTDSSYNQTAIQQWDPTTGTLITTTGPAIDAGRKIIIEVATVARGVEVGDVEDAEWHSLFEGYILSADVAQTPIVIECRDLGAQLADVQFPGPGFVNASDTTDTIQATIQALIEALGVTVAIDLYVPVLPDPTVLVGLFRYTTEPGIEALLRLVQINGWDLRYRWSDVHQAWRFTLKDPGRTRTDVDFELDSSMYHDVKRLLIDITPVRNEVWIWYRPDNDLGNDRTVVTASNGVSQGRYFKRSMVLQEADDSPINTAESAQLMADLIVFDISEPLAQLAVEMPFFWPIELHERVRFAPNGVHFDDDFDIFVASYRHTLSATQSRTTIEGRGKGAGSYWQWLARRPVMADGSNKPVEPDNTTSPTGFSLMNQFHDYVTNDVELAWNWNGDPTATFEVFVEIGSTFVSQGSVGTSTLTTYAVPGDIEPFREPPATPQDGIAVAFYVVARVGSTVVAASPICAFEYGNGP